MAQSGPNPDKSQRILEATFQLILSNGVEKISTAAIQRDADVSRTTLYRYFPNREALLEGVIGYMSDDVERRLKLMVAERPDPKDRLDIIIDLVVERQIQQAGLRLLQVDPGFVMEMVNRTLQRNVDILEAALDDVYRSAENVLGRPVDREIISNVMMRLFASLILLPAPPLPGDPRQTLQALFRSLLLDLRLNPSES